MGRWEHRVNMHAILTNDDLTFEQKRDTCVKLLQKSNLFSGTLFRDIFVKMLAAKDEDSFDDELEKIYDYADGARIWLGP